MTQSKLLKRKRGRPPKKKPMVLQVFVEQVEGVDCLKYADTGSPLQPWELVGKVISDAYVNSRGLMILDLIPM